MAHPRLQQAALYLSQQRYTEVNQLLRTHLSELPDDLDAYYLLTESYIGMDELAMARKVNVRALGLQPDNPYLHYQSARISLYQGDEQQALTQIDEAIQLLPIDAHFFATKSLILLQQKQYEAALTFANQGLNLAPDDTDCLNARSRALVKLKRPEEALSTIATSLEKNPRSSQTHASLGWTQLETGDHRKALEHFREALRLQPGNDYAKSGMVEAMRAKSLLYRWFMHYKFWMARLSAKYQWGFIIGIYVLYRILLSLHDNFPALQPLILPLILVYVAFAMSTWFIEPLANIFLLANPYGRFALDKQERITALLVGSTLVLSLIALTVYLFTWQAGWMATAFYCFVLMIPLGSMLRPPLPKARRQMIYYTSGLALVGMVALYFIWQSSELEGGGWFSLIFVFGIFIYQFVLNARLTKY